MTLQELFDFIERNEDVGINAPASQVQISVANVKLKQEDIPTIPEDFATLLMKFNGLSNNGSVILGINTGTPMFPDLVKYNLNLLKGRKTSSIILGYDDANYLIYDNDVKKYRIIDKDDYFEFEASSADLTKMVPYILKI